MPTEIRRVHDKTDFKVPQWDIKCLWLKAIIYAAECSQLVLVTTNVLHSTNLFFTHCRHHRQHEILSFLKSTFNLQKVESLLRYTKNWKIRFLAFILFKKYTWFSRVSSVGSLRSSLVFPFSVRRDTWPKEWTNYNTQNRYNTRISKRNSSFKTILGMNNYQLPSLWFLINVEHKKIVSHLRWKFKNSPHSCTILSIVSLKTEPHT